SAARWRPSAHLRHYGHGKRLFIGARLTHGPQVGRCVRTLAHHDREQFRELPVGQSEILRAVARVAHDRPPVVAVGEGGALEKRYSRHLTNAADARYLHLQLPVAHGAAERPTLPIHPSTRQRPEQTP